MPARVMIDCSEVCVDDFFTLRATQSPSDSLLHNHRRLRRISLVATISSTAPPPSRHRPSLDGPTPECSSVPDCRHVSDRTTVDSISCCRVSAFHHFARTFQTVMRVGTISANLNCVETAGSWILKRGAIAVGLRNIPFLTFEHTLQYDCVAVRPRKRCCNRDT
jgi:hypothetical protein